MKPVLIFWRQNHASPQKTRRISQSEIVKSDQETRMLRNMWREYQMS